MNTPSVPKTMIPIWVWVGLILTIYGVIVTGLGLYYVVVPETKTATASLNPSLWWGAVMLVAGIIFLVGGLKIRKSERAVK